MKEVFRYTFLTIAEWKKFLLVVLVVSILTILEGFPIINVASLIFEKLILLSVGIFLIYILRHSSTPDIFYENLTKNSFSTFLFHFIPSASGILLALMIISFFWFGFFIMILELTGAMFVLANPHNFLLNLATTTMVTKILVAFYLIYLSFYGYIFLGKLGEALSKENFKESFLSMISSLIDFKGWIKTFNLKYFIIFTVWSIIVFLIYSMTFFAYFLYIFPMMSTNTNIALFIIPLFTGITVIITYFTFFSAYFSYETTVEN